MVDETAFTVRGIDNISNVSCHVSCAIQILCHAIPPIRQLLLRLLDHHHGTGETNNNNGTTIPNSHNVLVNELLDFVSGGSSRPHSSSSSSNNNNNNNHDGSCTLFSTWNPRRLFTYLKYCHNIDYEQVGDPSTTLIRLLRLLIPPCETLLKQSVWEGQTRQVLEGYRRFQTSTITTNDDYDDNVHHICQDYLQRTKYGKIKDMACPLVLRGTSSSKTQRKQQQQQQQSMLDLLHHCTTEPQVVQGLKYPWDAMGADTFTECMVDQSHLPTILKCHDDDIPATTSTTWMTIKRTELHRIPRVWLLHLERPRPLEIIQNLWMESDHTNPPPIYSVEVPFMFDAETVHTRQVPTSSSSPIDATRMILQGAILQVIDLTDDDDDVAAELLEEEIEVHSVALLWSSAPHEESSLSSSWVLIDDEQRITIDDDRASMLLAGSVVTQPNSNDDTESKAYYGATLLVYAMSEEEEVQQQDWMDTINEILQPLVKKGDNSNESITSNPENLVGRRLKIKWAKGKYYPGVVTRYDASNGKHQVLYDDGDVKEYILAKKTIEWEKRTD
ncbi:hypothetical protein IV203_001801 [Nitzschia inconspicua]|uniref:Uncharacterized protein n=1 Tax=Nitzschia inconspicua TaxID=303405 RepID=A0A9K3L7Z6_9STRA|nr:hypothetical protein IV203_001801 [Nitzschia inconspicua]